MRLTVAAPRRHARMRDVLNSARRGMRRRSSTARRGQVLVIVGVGMTVFVAITGLVVDYGIWLTDQRAMRNAADAAAQAGVSELALLPSTSAKQASARQHAMIYLNDQLGLGLASGEIAGAAIAASSADGFGSEDGTSYAGADRFRIRTPVGAADSCTNRDWGNRAVSVRIDHESPRFFSGIFFGGTQSVDVCATSVIEGRGYAIAVLKPNANTGSPQGPNVTMAFAGSDSFVEVCGGDVGINSLFKGGAAPGPGDPAYVKFMDSNSSVPCLTDNENRMELTLDTPSPSTWEDSPPQVRIEGASSATFDDPYLAPRHLPSYIKIPNWGSANYGALAAADATTTPITMTDTTPGNGTCTPPAVIPPYTDAIAPGKYNLLQVGVDEKRWLCPGVYHFVQKPGTDGLDLKADAILGGQGVTLVFENNSVMDIRSGAAILLNSTGAGGTVTPAPWTTGDAQHDVAITIYVEPHTCGPVPAVTCTSSEVFTMQAHAGLDVKGVIFGPTDRMKIAGNGLHNGAGEIWAWTLDYRGQSTLRQDYEGNDPGYPLIVE
jgi:putative Flp pilus-assembly TadE/G-like protein